VPVAKISKTTTSLELVSKEKKGKGKSNSKKTLIDVIARGELNGTNNVEADLNGFMLDFKGNFKGAFEKESTKAFPFVCYYFEGEISNLKILRIDGK
jgi:hypothetical protein